MNEVPQSELSRWYACHTKPRSEKKFTKLLEEAGHEHYLPLLKTSHRYPGTGIKRFSKPLFPGYVFAKLIPGQKAIVFKREVLVRTLWIEDQDRFLRQLEAVRRVLDSGLPLSLEPLFEKGQVVTIKAGPLKGLEAIVDDPADPKGILVQVDVMDRALLIPVSPSWLLS